MKIDSKRFDFSSFLSKKIPVQDIDEAVEKHSMVIENFETGETFSNVQASDFIDIKRSDLNTLAIYIPDSMKKIRYKATILDTVLKIYKRYGIYNMATSYERGQAIIHDIKLDKKMFQSLIIASVHVPNIAVDDIEFFISLGVYIKQRIVTEGIPISINDALAIV